MDPDVRFGVCGFKSTGVNAALWQPADETLPLLRLFE
jgi:hypothetical protein